MLSRRFVLNQNRSLCGLSLLLCLAGCSAIHYTNPATDRIRNTPGVVRYPDLLLQVGSSTCGGSQQEDPYSVAAELFRPEGECSQQWREVLQTVELHGFRLLYDDVELDMLEQFDVIESHDPDSCKLHWTFPAFVPADGHELDTLRVSVVFSYISGEYQVVRDTTLAIQVEYGICEWWDSQTATK